MKAKIKVAVMGCVVNGPGEAREADIGLAGGHGLGIIFKKGEVFKKLPEAELLPAFLEELRRLEEAQGEDTNSA
jgi:(E)-4-hydroxy-3-methylbut-2-enyl-diphosphate synthase